MALRDEDEEQLQLGAQQATIMQIQDENEDLQPAPHLTQHQVDSSPQPPGEGAMMPPGVMRPPPALQNMSHHMAPPGMSQPHLHPHIENLTPPGLSGPPQPPGMGGGMMPPGVSLPAPIPPPAIQDQLDKARPQMDDDDDDDDEEQIEEDTMMLPQALEKMLAYKDMRAQEVGVDPNQLDTSHPHPEVTVVTEDFVEEAEEEETQSKEKAESKNKRKKKKKKRSRRARQSEMKTEQVVESEQDEGVEVEYIQEEFSIYEPGYAEFARVFEAFKIVEEKPVVDTKTDKQSITDNKPADFLLKAKNIANLQSDDDDEEEEADNTHKDSDKTKLSKKKMKKLNRLSVAELKQLVSRPDVVEMHDVTAHDPKLLVALKATKNTVSVPRHWCFKRKYLQGKRGIEKQPFELPAFIKATGIMEMRQALQDKEDQKTLKSKMRERVRPKMGKIDIDYQKLHDAFFKWQTKPKMSIHGDLYYEGKEFETRLKEKKPGNLSDDLRTALGMPIGQNADKFPPPWLIAMQRYGPPPSYPNLKIPGLNAPIPETCAFGYHAGGWGKPPVDETGKPLYGDVFGTQAAESQVGGVVEEDLDKSYWGELESESSEEEEEEEESSEGEQEPEDTTGLVTPAEGGLVTPSGVTSVGLSVGMETPDMIELRKRRIEDAMEQGGDTPALYTVLPEKKAGIGANAMMGSAHVYDMTTATQQPVGSSKRSGEGVDVALNPEELDLDSAAMQAKYEETVREQQQSQLEKEDLSDMVAEHAAKQKKRKKQQDTGKASKKYKEFKF